MMAGNEQESKKIAIARKRIESFLERLTSAKDKETVSKVISEAGEYMEELELGDRETYDKVYDVSRRLMRESSARSLAERLGMDLQQARRVEDARAKFYSMQVEINRAGTPEKRRQLVSEKNEFLSQLKNDDPATFNACAFEFGDYAAKSARKG